MSAKRKKITERDVQGLKYFRRLLPLFERLHEVGCQRDKAGNRRLHMDQYCARRWMRSRTLIERPSMIEFVLDNRKRRLRSSRLPVPSWESLPSNWPTGVPMKRPFWVLSRDFMNW